MQRIQLPNSNLKFYIINLVKEHDLRKINNIELNSKSDANCFVAKFKDGKFQEIFPEVEIIMSMRTWPNYAVSVSSYPNKETADSVCGRRCAKLEDKIKLIK